MTDRVLARVRRAVRPVVPALRAALVSRDHPPARRRRLRVATTWLLVPVALLWGAVTLDETVWASPGAELGVLIVLPVVVAAVVLLGPRPVTSWRIAVLVNLAWLLLAPSLIVDQFRYPWTLVVLLMVALVVVATRCSRPVVWGAWAWTVVVLVLGARSDAVIGWFVVVTAVVAVTDASRQRMRAQEEAAHEREARARQEGLTLLLEERARIARDLHDVVAHHMSMVAVQAESAPYRIAGMDDAARAEFASIAEAARAALSDVRGILTVLRDGEGGPERAPQPTLADLDALVESARAAGARVRLAVTGDRRPLRAAVELAAYRIVQESLANAARHASGAPVEVGLDYGPDALAVTVTNPRPPEAAGSGPGDATALGERAASGAAGQARPGAGGGHGLVGMRERVTLLGGDLAAGPTPEGGFRVAARLPVTDQVTEGES